MNKNNRPDVYRLVSNKERKDAKKEFKRLREERKNLIAKSFKERVPQQNVNLNSSINCAKGRLEYGTKYLTLFNAISERLGYGEKLDVAVDSMIKQMTEIKAKEENALLM